MRLRTYVLALLAVFLLASSVEAQTVRSVQEVASGAYGTDSNGNGALRVTYANPAPPSTSIGAANGTGVAATEYGDRVTHETVLTLTATSLTMTDATTAGCHGALKIYDFPAGPILVLGAQYNLTTLAGSGGIGDTAALVGSLGSVTNDTANATLTSTEADVIASTTGTLSGGAGTLAKHGSIVTTAFDGHTTPFDLFLNLSVPDAGSSASDTVAVTGTVTVFWINLGDYT